MQKGTTENMVSQRFLIICKESGRGRLIIKNTEKRIFI